MKENHFIHRISKDKVQELPVVSFEGEVIIVDDNNKIPSAVEYLSCQSVIGVDTESRPSFVKGTHYPTALLQMATEDRCYLFRLNRIGLPQSITDLFSNPKICKIGLAFKDDINGLRRLRNFVARNCIDLQQIVGQYGILDLGLQKIHAICFGQKISKSQQLTNWENEILTIEQARYASTDAWSTLLIYKELKQTSPLSRKEVEQIYMEDKERQLKELAEHDNSNSTSK